MCVHMPMSQCMSAWMLSEDNLLELIVIHQVDYKGQVVRMELTASACVISGEKEFIWEKSQKSGGKLKKKSQYHT